MGDFNLDIKRNLSDYCDLFHLTKKSNTCFAKTQVALTDLILKVHQCRFENLRISSSLQENNTTKISR